MTESKLQELRRLCETRIFKTKIMESPEGPKLTEDEMKAILREADKYAFQVPYDGTNDFYNLDRLDGFQAGAEWGIMFEREQMKLRIQATFKLFESTEKPIK